MVTVGVKGLIEIAFRGNPPQIRATGRHLPYRITVFVTCHPLQVNAPHQPARKTGTRFTYPGGMEG